jgi:hypothetical protein
MTYMHVNSEKKNKRDYNEHKHSFHPLGVDLVTRKGIRNTEVVFPQPKQNARGLSWSFVPDTDMCQTLTCVGHQRNARGFS